MGAVEKIINSSFTFMDDDYEKELRLAYDDLEAYLLSL